MNYAEKFESQKEFFYSMKTRDVSFRVEQLKKLKDILKANETLLYDAIYRDFRKSKFDTYANELNIIYTEIDYFIKNIGKLSQAKRVTINLANIPGKSYICYEPLGTVLIIGAWNYPYQLTIAPIVSAIASGNTCFIKPSELPVHTMQLMAKLINENFPANYLYVVEGGIPETTELLALPFDKIFFTGSPKVGKIVYEAAAKHLTPVVLELGGKSPAIVTKSADLDIAAKRIVWGKFINGGQTCIAPDYLLVEASVKERLVQNIQKKLKECAYEPGAEHYVSIINERNFDRILQLIAPEKVVYGGKSDKSLLYIEPTIMDNVDWQDPTMQEEIFGPVLPIITFTDLDQVLEKVKRLEKPLAAYLFSNDPSEKKKFNKELSFGGGCINDTVMHITHERLPFGGVGNSGMGNYHGKFGFLTFSHQKSIIEKSLRFETNLKYPPYSVTKLNWIKRLIVERLWLKLF